MKPILKTGRFESPTFTAWVRRQPCCLCPDTAPGSEAHHVLGRGRTGTLIDVSCIPVCRVHHMNCEGLPVTVDGSRLPPIQRDQQLIFVGLTLLGFFARATGAERASFAAEWERFAESRGPWEVPS